MSSELKPNPIQSNAAQPTVEARKAFEQGGTELQAQDSFSFVLSRLGFSKN